MKNYFIKKSIFTIMALHLLLAPVLWNYEHVTHDTLEINTFGISTSKDHADD